MKRRPPKIVGCSPEDLALRDEKVVKGTVKKKRDTHGTQVSVSRLTYKPGDSACGAPDWLGESQISKKRQKTPPSRARPSWAEPRLPHAQEMARYGRSPMGRRWRWRSPLGTGQCTYWPRTCHTQTQSA